MHLLKTSGAVNVINQVMDQVLINADKTIRAKNPSLPDEAYAVIGDELKTGIQEWMQQILVNQMEYYSNRLTKAEVAEVIKMYESDAYKKMLKLGQEYVGTTLQPLLKDEAPAVTQKIIQRINERLKE